MFWVCISLWNIARTSPTLFASHFDNIDTKANQTKPNQCVAFFQLTPLPLLALWLLLLLSFLWHNKNPFLPEFHRFLHVGWETTTTTTTKHFRGKKYHCCITNRIQCASIKHTTRHQTAFNTNHSGYACVISI